MQKINKIVSYLQGWSRYHLYYSRFSWLIRKHIREQIEMRINSMNSECYLTGSCIKCGCSTTALQMSNKACEGYCYPSIVDKNRWRRLNKIKVEGIVIVDGELWDVVKTDNLISIIKHRS